MTTVRDLVRVCSVADLERDRLRVTTAAGRAVLLVLDEGRVFALDNRCPHMGFPLRRGTVEGGILTCHWHHAKFDLASGCTFDLFADDAPTFHVEVRDGDVWLDPAPPRADRREHWLGRLQVGLEQDISLVLAKSAVALTEQGAATDALTRAALFGLRNRRAGWSQGMTILTALAEVLPVLDPGDHALALFHGLRHVAASTAGQPPEFDLEPLSTSERRPERFLEWFRYFVEVRQADAAERTLVTAVEALPARAAADLVFAACTDHLYLDTGHTLDFANKAFELLDLVGWDQARHVLPSLVPALVRSQRMEETSTWRHPVDVAALVRDAQAELVVPPDRTPRTDWRGHQDLAEVVLDGEPAEALAELVRLAGDGVPVTELSAAVAYAAVRRAVHFPTSNEFGDWETVLHGFTYANAVDQALRRAPSPLLARGVLDAAMAVSLERFLNVPRRAIPSASGRAGRAGRLEILAAFDEQGRADEAGQIVADAVAGGEEAVVRALGHALLREDGQFHHFQMYEAMVRQWSRFRGRPEAGHVLVGAARYLAAHAPTVRATGQTFDIAARLHRGESLHEDA